MGRDETDQLIKANRIDAICDRFEAAWSTPNRVRIEDVLRAASESDQPDLFVALLSVEIELRRDAGERLTSKEYEQRFPQWKQAIRDVFLQVRQSKTPRSSASPTIAAGTISISAPSADTSLPAARQSKRSSGAPPKQIGRFEVQEVLGEGAFGTVYKARDPKLERLVAIKVPRAGVLQTAEDRQRFLREARAAGTLGHPNICPVYEVGEAETGDYIVMAFVEGKPLSSLIGSDKIGPKQVAACIRKLALALDEAHHQGVVHRDLKPANIMVNRRGEPIVMDFGLARLTKQGDALVTQTGQIMGSPAYMSPEQTRGSSAQIGPASDIYSLGVVFYELLCGSRPFAGTVTEVLGQILHVDPPRPTEFMAGIDPALEAICLKAMSKKPEARYQSMKDFAAALTSYLKGESETSTRGGEASKTQGRIEEEENQLQAMFAELADEQRSLARHVKKAARKSEEAVRAGKPPWLMITSVAAAMGLIVALSIWFFVQKDTIAVVINIPNLDPKDPSLTFFLDNSVLKAEELAKPIELKSGDHELIVNKNDKLFKRFKFQVGKEQTDPVVVQEVPTKPPEEPAGPPRTYALKFDGDGDCVVLPIPKAPNTFTVEAWVRPAPRTVAGHNIIIRADFGDEARGLQFAARPDVKFNPVFGGIVNGDWRSSRDSQPQNPGDLIHLAGMWSDDTPQLFVNGQPSEERINFGREPPTGVNQWVIGAKSVGQDGQPVLSFQGVVEAVRISDIVRYTGAFKPRESWVPDEHTIALYRFDEGQGSVLHDLSGHGYDGKILGAQWIKAGESNPALSTPVAPPGDGWVQLFDGRSLSQWKRVVPQGPGWKVGNGYMEVVPGAGNIMTRDQFPLDFEFHAEFWIPNEPGKSGQRGNSGIYLHGRHELQIVDSFNNPTITDNKTICGALYGEVAPTRRVERPPETWQEMDVTYRSPRVDREGKLTAPGRLTVVLNGQTIIENEPFSKIAGLSQNQALGQPGPIMLQDHRAAVRYRDLRIRPLQDTETSVVAIDELPQNGYSSAPWVMPDGLTLYFQFTPKGEKQRWIWRADRKSTGSTFENVRKVLAGSDPALTADGLEIILLDNRSLFSAVRASVGDDFGPPRKITEFGDVDGFLACPCISEDGLVLWADHIKDGKVLEEFRFRRNSRSAAWEKPEVVGWQAAGWTFDDAPRTLFVSPKDGYAFCRGISPFGTGANGSGADGNSGNLIALSSTDRGATFANPVVVRAQDQVVDGKFPRYLAKSRELFFAGPLQSDGTSKLYVIRNFDLPQAKTQQIASDHFVPLFNGKDLTGWKGAGDSSAWRVEDGCLVFDYGAVMPPAERRGWIFTEQDFQDFELQLEFQMGALGNSGVGFRCDPAQARQAEIGILDEQSPDAAKARDDMHTGALWGHSATTNRARVPHGSWIPMTIIVKGRHVTTQVDGVTTLDADLDQVQARAKPPIQPGITRRSGPIGLQNYGGAVRFRNIRVRPLSSAVATTDGFVPLFNGTDLTNWKGNPAFWTVRDGILVGKLPDQPQDHYSYLCSESEFRNFELRASVKFSGRNSGLQFRSKFIDPLHFDVGGPQIEFSLNDGIFWGTVIYAPTGEPKFPVDLNKAKPALRSGEFNDIFLRCVDQHVRVEINGTVVNEFDDPQCPPSGIIGLQLHKGFPGMEVEFREISVRELAPVAATTEAEWRPLFDAFPFDQWQGSREKWSLNGAVLTGQPGVTSNCFLFSPSMIGDMDLRFQVRVAASDNSGVQIRSEIENRENWTARGPQCDFGNRQGDFWGGLYGEKLAGGWLLKPVSQPPLNRDGWNDYEIRCRGKHVTIKVNDVMTVDGDVENMADTGLVAFQSHKANQKPVEFRNLEIRLSAPDAPTE